MGHFIKVEIFNTSTDYLHVEVGNSNLNKVLYVFLIGHVLHNVYVLLENNDTIVSAVLSSKTS